MTDPVPIDRSVIRVKAMLVAPSRDLTESDGRVVPVVWRPFDDALEPLPLFPAGVARLALNLAH